MNQELIKVQFKTLIYFVIYLSIQLFLQKVLPTGLFEPKDSLLVAGILVIASVVLTATVRFIRERGHLIVIALNGIAAAFAIHAYMTHIERFPSWQELGIILVGASIYCLAMGFLVVPIQSEKKKILCALLLMLIPLISLIPLWIIVDKLIYSQAFFACIMSISFFLGAAISMDESKPLAPAMLYASFGSIAIVVVVALIIGSSGDLLEGLVPETGTWKRKKNRSK